MEPFKYTPFGDLCEGERFIRIAGYPVKLEDIKGRYRHPYFYPEFNPHKHHVYVMVKNLHGDLIEQAIEPKSRVHSRLLKEK